MKLTKTKRIEEARTCLRLNFHRTTTSTPEQYVAGLTGFGPGRSKLVVNSADASLKVHQRGGSQAEVAEVRAGSARR
jgi:hypothetical protein